MPSATTVATRSPAPASPANVSGRRAAAARERVDLGEHLAGGGAGDVRAGGRGAAAAASTAAFLAQPASSTPVTSLVCR